MAATDLDPAPSAALLAALTDALRDLGAPDDFQPRLDRPGDPTHGDLTTNAAMVLAGTLRRPPREIATELAGRLAGRVPGLASVAVAGPGFLNFQLDDTVVWAQLAEVAEADGNWGRSRSPDPERVNVEFVSANPTGPLHVAHGRGAAIGDAVASLLEWTGHSVSREYYVNDAGRQIDLLGASVNARLRELGGEDAEIPEGGYQGGYVAELARRLVAEGVEPVAGEAAEELEGLSGRASAILRDEQEQDLERFGVRYESWVPESGLFRDGRVQTLLERLEAEDAAYRDEGALWLRTTRHGDEKDRVLVKRDGAHTYFVSDIAYHLDKKARGYDRAIDVWGADHHGHVIRMRAALRAAGIDPGFLEVIIIQLVTVMKDGEEVRMSKRAGTFETLRDLYDVTGTDVARYFFLMRRAEVPMTFDLDLALDTSEKNPVYKVQYAHARMCSIFERAGIAPDTIRPAAEDFSPLHHPSERAVAKAILRFPEVVSGAARARAPYQVCNYLEELAGEVNAWYHEGNVDPELRVLAVGPAREARLGLANAVRITLRQGLHLLGLSAPEKMVREEELE